MSKSSADTTVIFLADYRLSLWVTVACLIATVGHAIWGELGTTIGFACATLAGMLSTLCLYKIVKTPPC